MRTEVNLRIEPGFPLLFVVLLVGLPTTMIAGPHRFQKWTDGEIVNADVDSHHFTIHQAGSATESRFEWNRDTEFFNGTAKLPVPTEQIRSSDLRSGEHVRVLYEHRGTEMMAKRIVLAHSRSSWPEK